MALLRAARKTKFRRERSANFSSMARRSRSPTWMANSMPSITHACIAAGRWAKASLRGKMVTCPWHGWTYDVTTGQADDESGRRRGLLPGGNSRRRCVRGGAANHPAYAASRVAEFPANFPHNLLVRFFAPSVYSSARHESTNDANTSPPTKPRRWLLAVDPRVYHWDTLFVKGKEMWRQRGHKPDALRQLKQVHKGDRARALPRQAGARALRARGSEPRSLSRSARDRLEEDGDGLARGGATAAAGDAG